ncbi:hypothetical protein [Ramlibacter pallidus]|uniref:Uncharacterized protein n=1 Tax=Ramlibacter pallidus TaxID=2780087 RepID=A0ABR9S051_9BURK|nr:hypothetical protein [Ramlibacter pallidus]MBE7366897.1 hypothetical protein [Ramlibacter pallidus]
MNTREQPPSEQAPPAQPIQQQQQPQPGEHHAGRGSESAMKQMRVWEQRRASDSGGKRRPGPA